MAIKKKSKVSEVNDDFYNDLDKKTKYQGNCSCLGMVIALISVGVVIFLIFSYFYLNK
jgi:hypothetical protein